MHELLHFAAFIMVVMSTDAAAAAEVEALRVLWLEYFAVLMPAFLIPLFIQRLKVSLDIGLWGLLLLMNNWLFCLSVAVRFI